MTQFTEIPLHYLIEKNWMLTSISELDEFLGLLEIKELITSNQHMSLLEFAVKKMKIDNTPDE